MDVVADLDSVWVTHDSAIIATHARAWAPAPGPDRSRPRGPRHGDAPGLPDPTPPPRTGGVVEVRDLADYDEIFGFGFDQQLNQVLEVAS